MVDERGLLIEEVNFKWLMAGHGWWVDMAMFHREPSYAAHYLKLAEQSGFRELRQCAAMLEAKMAACLSSDIAG